MSTSRKSHVGILSVAILLAFAALADPAEASIEGCWTGWIETGGHRLETHGWSLDGERFVTLHLPRAGLYDLRFDVTENEDAITLRHEGGRGPVILKGTREGATIRGTWSLGPVGGPFELVRTSSGAAPYTKRDVEFESNGTRLVATVLVPNGDGPYPGIVWTHGSGSIGRASSSYVREAYLLAEHGIASILYDKRGVGRSEGTWKDASFEQLARDAVAASKLLRSVPGIDPDRIGIGGLSQGPSWLVPLALDRGEPFSFAILLSASAVTPAKQHVHVVKTRVRNAGFPEADVIRAERVAAAEAEYQRTGEGAQDVDALLHEVRDEAWFPHARLAAPPVRRFPETMLGWWSLDPIPLWRQAPPIPVLAMFGSDDPLIDVARSRRLLEETLGERLTAHTFPGANHELLIDTGSLPVLPARRDEILLAWIRRATDSK